MKSHTFVSSVFAVALISIACNVGATQFDFNRKIQGDIFEGGQKTGAYEYLFNYNTNPIHMQATPDPIDPNDLVTYTPWPAFQDQFQLDVFLSLSNSSSTPGNYHAAGLITSFTIWNDFEFNFSNPDDKFLITAQTEINNVLHDITLGFTSDNSGVLSSVSLNDILMGQSEGIFTPSNGYAYFPGAITRATSAFFADVNSVGPIFVNAPSPATLPLVVIGLSGLYAISRRRKTLQIKSSYID